MIVYFKLDEPVFFQHYYDQKVKFDEDDNLNSSFDLKYITNSYNDRVVVGIEFLEHPEVIIDVAEEDDSSYVDLEESITTGVNYLLYSLRTLNCNIRALTEEENIDEIVLTQAKILFDDNSEMLVNIGEIHLYRYISEESPLKRISASGFYDKNRKINYNILEDITIKGTDSYFAEKFDDEIRWKINDINSADLVGVIFNKGDDLNFTADVDFTKDIRSQYLLFDIRPKITYTTNDGIYYSERFCNTKNLYNHYSFKKLYRYIKSREAI